MPFRPLTPMPFDSAPPPPRRQCLNVTPRALLHLLHRLYLLAARRVAPRPSPTQSPHLAGCLAPPPPLQIASADSLLRFWRSLVLTQSSHSRTRTSSLPGRCFVYFASRLPSLPFLGPPSPDLSADSTSAAHFLWPFLSAYPHASGLLRFFAPRSCSAFFSRPRLPNPPKPSVRSLFAHCLDRRL